MRSKNLSRILVGILSLMLVLTGCAQSSPAPAPATPAPTTPGTPEAPKPLTPIKVKVGIAGTSINFAHFWVAEKQGFFKEEGLDMTTVVFNGGPEVIQAMVAGEVPIAITSSLEPMACRVEGCDLKIVSTYVPYSPYQLLSKPEIKTAADMKGKIVAVSKIGAESHKAAMNLVRTLNIDAGKDVSYAAIGGQTQRLQALLAGSVDAAVVSPPGSYQLRAQGYTLIADLIASQVETGHENVVTTERAMKADPEVQKRFIKALSRGIHYFITEPAGTQKIIAEYLMIDPVAEKQLIEDTWKEYAEKATAKIPYPSVKGITNQIPELAELKKEPKLLNEKPEQFYDDSAIKEIEASGFYKTLWGN